MKKTLVILTLLLVFSSAGTFAGTVPPDSTIYSGLTGKQLIDSLRARYRPSHTIAYAGTPDVRDTLFGVVDKTASDSITCVYSTFTIYMQPGQDPDDWAYSHDFNAEHSWPQSYLNTSQTPDPTGDMHHLFPSDIEVNSSRGNWPFIEIPDAQTETWYYNNSTSTTIPSSNIDLYAEYGSNTFEPREQQKGNTSRAMYYMLTMYQLPDTTLAWWTGQRDILYTWHCNDPADGTEIARTRKIAPYQSGKVNPFILDSTLIRRAYFPSLVTSTSVSFSPVSASKSESAGSCSLKVAITNPSGSAATTVQVVLTGGTGTAADVNNYSTQTLSFPAGSSAVQSTVLAITDDALVEGTETLVFTLRNVSGGTSAAIGSDSVFTLTITDNDAPTTTTVSFNPTALTRAEGIGSCSLTVAITNPSGSAATTADVVLASGTGTAADINSYTTRTLTFPAGSSALQYATLTITDDALAEGTETLVFKLRNVSGGNSAAPGADSACTLTLTDNDVAPGDTFLYEPFDYTAGTLLTANNWIAHSSAGTNAITVVSPGLTYSGYKGKAVTNACSLYSTGEDVHRMFTAQTSGPVYASFLVNVRSASTTGDYFFNFAPNPWATAYYGRIYIKSDGGSNLAFGLTKASETPVTYTGTVYATNTTYLVVLKYSMVGGTLNDSASLFVISSTIPASEPGTPTIGPIGASTIADPASIGAVALRQGSGGPVLIIDDIKIGSAWSSAPLAVELSSFTSMSGPGQILLNWRTASELNCYQWQIERSLDFSSGYKVLATIPASGNVSGQNDYSWTDRGVEPGQMYYYRLKGFGLDGSTAVYGPVTASAGPAFNGNVTANGIICSPNPFKNNITFRYNLSQAGPAKLDIYNISGQLVRSFPENFVPAGQEHIDWDGRSEGGAACPGGVYIVRLTTESACRQGRIILIR